MALTQEQEAVWNELSTLPKKSFHEAIRHTPEDTSWEAPGVYVIWDGNEPVYIGCALMARPEDGSKSRMWGLKDRLGSHQLGQISGSSLAMAAWFCRIAPTLSPEKHAAIATHDLNPNILTEEYIRKLTFTCVPRIDAGQIEAVLYREKRPPFNNYQEFLRMDRLERKKAQQMDSAKEK